MTIKRRLIKIEKAVEEMENDQQIELEDTELLFNNAHLLLQIYNVKDFEQLRDIMIGDNV